MDIEALNNELSTTADPTLKRAIITEKLLACVPMIEMNAEMRKRITADMASLQSNDYVASLAEDDILRVTLTFAEELEMLDEETDDEDWDLLVEIIKSV